MWGAHNPSESQLTDPNRAASQPTLMETVIVRAAVLATLS